MGRSGVNHDSGSKDRGIRQYLMEKLPGWDLADADDFDRVSWRFRAASRGTIQVVYVQRTFGTTMVTSREPCKI
jgi:hypothetical protein